MRGIGKIVKPARTLTEDLALMKFQPDDIRMMAEMAGAPGLIAMGGQGVTPANSAVSGAPGGAPAMDAPAAAPGEAQPGKKVERLKKSGKKPMNNQGMPPKAPAAAPMGGAPGMPGAAPMAGAAPMGPPKTEGVLKPRVPSGKRPAGEGVTVGPGNDRLEVILSDLHTLVQESQTFDTTKNALMRSFTNICKIAQAVSDKLNESVPGNYEHFKKLDGLAEEALQVAEALRDGTLPIKSAEEAVNGYVKDLVEALAPFADELDIDLTKRLKSLA